MAKLQLVQDPAADALLDNNPLALLIGILLDKQVPIEAAAAFARRHSERAVSPTRGL